MDKVNKRWHDVGLWAAMTLLVVLVVYPLSLGPVIDCSIKDGKKASLDLDRF